MTAAEIAENVRDAFAYVDKDGERAEANAALDALVARCEEAERERDNHLRYRDEYRDALLECGTARTAAERRVEQLETALRNLLDVDKWTTDFGTYEFAAARAALEGEAS